MNLNSKKTLFALVSSTILVTGFGTYLLFLIDIAPFTSPISEEFSKTIISNANERSVYSVDAETIRIEKYSIKLDSFLTIFDTIPSNYGIRIFPGYENSKIIFILSFEPEIASGSYTYYKINGNLNELIGINFKQANELFDQFHDNVKINLPNVQGYLNHEPSRFYGKNEIISILYNLDIDYKDPANYKNYKLEIAGGAIGADELSTIIKYYYNEIPSDCDSAGYCELGFTCVMSIKERKLFGAWWSQLGNSFEIGKPCPPKCGSLTWN